VFDTCDALMIALYIYPLVMYICNVYHAYLFIFNDDCTMWSAGFYLICYLACKAWPVVDIMEHE
jgi:hypothetical protein